MPPAGFWLPWRLLLLLWLAYPARAQDTGLAEYEELKSQAENKFGPPAELLNGEKYYYPYSTSIGNPFLQVSGNGSLQIDGTVYRDQQLKYDIYNQLLVLEYRDQSFAPVSIVVGMERLDSFTIGGLSFKKYRDPEGNMQYGQVVYEGRYSLIYFWRKTYSPELGNGGKQYEFSESMRTSVILSDQHRYPYKGNRSFIRVFPKGDREQIKQEIKNQRIRVKKATDREMKAIMEKINQITGSDE